jgi:hypothetical protein
MDAQKLQTRPSAELDLSGDRPVGGPVPAGWREGTLTRAKELESLCAWVLANKPHENCDVLAKAIAQHLHAARQAAEGMSVRPRRRFWFLHNAFRSGSLLERAMSNLDAAEAQLLNFASVEFVLGQIPGLLGHVQRHLVRTDPRRLEFERIAQRLGVKDSDHPLLQTATEEDYSAQKRKVEQERGKIVTAMRAASSAALREQVRVKSFRNVLVITTILMALLAVGVALVGYLRPTMIPLCFAPEASGQAVVVCPTGQSAPFPSTPLVGADIQGSSTPTTDIDDAVKTTVTPLDLLVVELVGLTAAAVSAAAAIRTIRGSSERYGLPVALAALKLPTGAITAFLGLLLMRGNFVPGLSALDTSAQILAWALVFGYAQQLFTRLVDRQGQTVLDSVRGADKADPAPAP